MGNHPDPNRPTHAVTTIPGGGKTFAALGYAAKLAAMGHRIAIAQPSTRLIEQSYSDFAERFPNIVASRITSETHPGDVTRAIIRHSRDVAGSTTGEVVIISHAALLRLPYMHAQHEWDLIVDETPSATSSVEHTDIPAHMISCMRITPHGLRYSRVDPRHKSALRRIALGRAGNRYMEYRDLATMILSNRHDVFAIASQLDRAKLELKGKVTFFSILRTDALAGWRTSTVMSACLSDSLLYRIWTLDGMKWRDHRAIMSGLRSTRHDNGHLLTVHYATEEDWSKKRRDSSLYGSESNSTTMDAIISASLYVFGGKPHAYLVNRDREDELQQYGGDHLPNTSHGLNCYQHLDCAAAYSALNLTPAHIGFLGDMGLNQEEIRAGTYYASTYQAVLRISLRNPESKEPKHIVVMDRGCADYIAGLFAGSQVIKLLTCIPDKKPNPSHRPRRHLTDAMKHRHHRHQITQKLIDEIESIEVESSARNTETKGLEYISAFVSESDAGNHTPLFDLFDSLNARKPVAVYGCPINPADFITALREVFLPCVYADKRDNFLISPSHFDADLDPEKSRGRANVAYCNGIWLDNDGGAVTPDAFAALFPHLHILAYNSFRSTTETPKYRLYIPTTQVMSADAYTAITRQIIRVVEDAGYRDAVYLRKDKNTRYRNHGFDMSKIYPENLFFLPCQPSDPSGLIWQEYTGHHRKPLDVMSAVRNTILHPDPEPSKPNPLPTIEPQKPNINASDELRRVQAHLAANRQTIDQERQARVSAAIAAWQSCPSGAGNTEFFRLGARLGKAGLDLNDVRSMLTNQATYANSPRERLREIPGIIKRLKPAWA